VKTFSQLVAECSKQVRELFPWDLADKMENDELLLVDVREPYEYEKMHIEGSINVPRGILESACEYDYEETIPQLVEAREKDVIVICRSGFRSVFAAHMMQQLGYQSVWSLKTGLRGWNEFEQPLIDINGNEVDLDEAEEYFIPNLRPEQHKPA
jgi:rhodanese-related sulfurtransferase